MTTERRTGSTVDDDGSPSGPVGARRLGTRPVGPRGLLFVLRCSLSSTIAFLAASAIGLGHPVWASISALIVSQESLAETNRSLGSRILGTVLGIATAVAVHATFRLSGLDAKAVEVAIITAVCALIAWERPASRVCMWTGPLVLLTATPAEPIGLTALHRGAEVLLGGLVGAGLHSVVEWAAHRVLHRARPEGGGPDRAG